MDMELYIPANNWQGFKDEIMSHFFVSDNPVLTKHNQDFDEEYVYARFSSDVRADILFVEETAIYFDGGFVD